MSSILAAFRRPAVCWRRRYAARPASRKSAAIARQNGTNEPFA
jgi:hypothetical protein